MKIYLAALYTSNFGKLSTVYRRALECEKRSRDELPYILESYHYVNKQSYVDAMRRDGVRVFLDSGAFSAFSKGVDIDLPRYCEYINRNDDIVEMASVLDGIGDPLLTWQNQQAMESEGTRPLPCFHYGEPEEYLQHYIDNYDYITLGGMVPVSTPQLIMWLDRIWQDYLTDDNGKTKVKVHGFGLTSIRLMERYPWYSVDSSSWVQVSSNGGAFIMGNKALGFSTTSPARKTAGQHFTTITDLERERVRKFVVDKGYDVELLSTSWVHRWCFNIQVFNDLNIVYAHEPAPFLSAQPELFV